ncbi:MAG: tRNA (adenosine(37)-N6)-threonylcarbamoyltransferase complex dimerization subunit type 1 TsaB [bacterium]|nr:tRNA (adenosine(37)-N6)-threonylcarbamoyltransferase complex dimerization subunit type 1 TsaB [bacterium]
MRVLAIEVSTRRGSVAVVGPEGTMGERSADVPGAHLEWLLGAVTAVLGNAHMGSGDVDALSVSLGPGGFVGLRIGVATAAAWAHAAGRPLVGIPTLDVIAAGAVADAGSSSPGLVLSATDARRGEVVAALYRRGALPSDLVRLTPDLLVAPSAIRDLLPPIDEPVVVAGDALRLHAPAILEALHPWASQAPCESWWPHASVLGAVGRTRLLRGERHDPMRLVPIYARGPEARAWEERSVVAEKGGA